MDEKAKKAQTQLQDMLRTFTEARSAGRPPEGGITPSHIGAAALEAHKAGVPDNNIRNILTGIGAAPERRLTTQDLRAMHEEASTWLRETDERLIPPKSAAALETITRGALETRLTEDARAVDDLKTLATAYTPQPQRIAEEASRLLAEGVMKPKDIHALLSTVPAERREAIGREIRGIIERAPDSPLAAGARGLAHVIVDIKKESEKTVPAPAPAPPARDGALPTVPGKKAEGPATDLKTDLKIATLADSGALDAGRTLMRCGACVSDTAPSPTERLALTTVAAAERPGASKPSHTV